LRAIKRGDIERRGRTLELNVLDFDVFDCNWEQSGEGEGERESKLASLV
jgi:hypothetical protein